MPKIMADHNVEGHLDVLLIYYFSKLSRGATILVTTCSASKTLAARQAAPKGRPRVAADAGEGLPPPPRGSQRGSKSPDGLRAKPTLRIWTSPPWKDLWHELACDIESFVRLGIASDVSDAVLWRICQEQGILLLTGNRNADGEDSLESTIEKQRTDSSLPVLTIANPARILTDSGYAARAAERILEYLLALEQLRGAGRLYVP